eukprot:scaffold5893_cov154-Skeletonema_dohrnii-CCMP3373.AAC.1
MAAYLLIPPLRPINFPALPESDRICQHLSRVLLPATSGFCRFCSLPSSSLGRPWFMMLGVFVLGLDKVDGMWREEA